MSSVLLHRIAQTFALFRLSIYAVLSIYHEDLLKQLSLITGLEYGLEQWNGLWNGQWDSNE